MISSDIRMGQPEMARVAILSGKRKLAQRLPSLAFSRLSGLYTTKNLKEYRFEPTSPFVLPVVSGRSAPG